MKCFHVCIVKFIINNFLHKKLFKASICLQSVRALTVASNTFGMLLKFTTVFKKSLKKCIRNPKNYV